MSMRYPGGLIATSPVNARYPSGVWTQAQAAPYQAQNVWTRDQFWPYTTLLLQGDGATNGAQNNTFLDSSSNNFTITRNGNTTQGAFTPYEQDGYWSNFFDGSGDYLSIPDNAALDIPGDFTIEFWINVGAGNVDRAGIISHRDQSTFTDGTDWAIRVETSAGKIGFGYDSSGNYYDMGSYVVGEWAHYAITRSGTTIRTFKNGTQVATATSSSTWSSGSAFLIGRNVPSFDFSGYVSNVRLVKGTAVYTSSFTPSAAPLTAITNTSLLTCQSNRFKDNSTNNFTLTVNGNTSVQAFQPFPGATTWSASVLSGSGYFDGSGDYLTLPVNSAFDLGLNACCVEAWVYLTNTNEMALFATSANVNGQTRPNFYVRSNQIQLDFFNNVVIQANVTVPLNAWNHVAFTRASSSGPWRIFLNGVLQAYNATGSQNLLQTGAAQDVGRLYGGTTGQGYMCDLRIVNGSVPSAYVTSSTTIGATIFTPPTTPLTAITNTSLLLSYTNAGIYDNSMMNDLETVGNAQVSTSVVKYGTGSMAFDGSGDYLVARNAPILDLGSGDFTIESWVYMLSSTGIVLSQWNNGGNNSNYVYVSGGVLIFRVGANEYSGGSIPTSTWTHIAISRAGGVIRLFINGSFVTSATNSSNITTTSATVIGANDSGTGGANFFNGYIDDLRITKGAARYITNFTPPPARMPGQ